MLKSISIGLELNESSNYDALARRLRHHGATIVLPMQWMLQTSLMAEDIRKDVQAYLGPADRLLVTQVTSLSFWNLIDDN
jgi:hypothetical protein